MKDTHIRSLAVTRIQVVRKLHQSIVNNKIKEMKVENKNLCPESVKCLTEENSSVRIQSKRLENLMSNENGTETAIIEPTEPENLVVELDPAQILLGMFDDAPDPTPFEANDNNTVIIEYAFFRAFDI